jgi:hypothetical protein
MVGAATQPPDDADLAIAPYGSPYGTTRDPTRNKLADDRRSVVPFHRATQITADV